MEKFYIISIFLGLIIVGAFLVLSFKMKNGIGKYNLKVYGITIIALLVTLLAISPIETTNISPAYGILGAIAGYLFGLKEEK
jgi:hypothetical protein